MQPDTRALGRSLIDTFGQASFIAGLAAASRDPAMVAKLEAFRDSLPAEQREPALSHLQPFHAKKQQ